MRCVAATLILCVLAACTGGENGAVSPLPNARVANSADEARVRVTATLRIVIPKRRGGKPHHYLSPATRSISIAIAQSGKLRHENFDLTAATNPACTASPVVCSLKFLVSPGAATLSLTTYDGLLGAGGKPTGNQLSANQDVPTKFVRSKANVVKVTLEGIPASIAFIPGAASTLTGNASAGYVISKCFSAAQLVSVLGVDADANFILGPGAPVTTLSSGDPAHLAVTSHSAASPNAFTLTRPSIPSPNSTVYLTATVTPAADSGGATLHVPIAVKFNSDVCGVFTEYPISGGGDPEGITAGPDGALWFTEYADRVGRITTTGTMTFPSSFPSTGSRPRGITAGPDGNVWFTENGTSRIAQEILSGGLNEVSVPTSASYPVGITAGSDGNLWFVEFDGNNVGRFTTSFAKKEFPIPTLASFPYGIASGADGNLWFTEGAGNNIGRITTTGSITEYPIPTAASGPNIIAAGPDDAMWFVESSANKVGRIAFTGAITEYAIPTAASGPYGITRGPDGALWFTECSSSKIGRITTGGAITEFAVPTPVAAPRGITTGPDGALWFTENYGEKIGRLQ